jgi:hypothetical protein
MALLAQTHNLLRHVPVREEGRRPRFANHLEPADLASSVRRGTERIRRWGPRLPSAAWLRLPRSSPSTPDHDQPRPVAGRIRLNRNPSGADPG